MTSLDINLGKVHTSIANLMQKNSIQMNVQSAIFGLLTGVLKSSEFINSLKSDVLKIHEDKKITMNDMPIMCNIVVNSMSYIKTFSQTEKIAQTLDQEATKYIVFGIMYFVFLEVNASEADLVAFTLMFDTLWQMISFDPKELMLSVNNSCCCKKQ